MTCVIYFVRKVLILCYLSVLFSLLDTKKDDLRYSHIHIYMFRTLILYLIYVFYYYLFNIIDHYHQAKRLIYTHSYSSCLLHNIARIIAALFHLMHNIMSFNSRRIRAGTACIYLDHVFVAVGGYLKARFCGAKLLIYELILYFIYRVNQFTGFACMNVLFILIVTFVMRRTKHPTIQLVRYVLATTSNTFKSVKYLATNKLTYTTAYLSKNMYVLKIIKQFKHYNGQ